MDAETRARELLAGGLIGLREAIAAALRRARAEAIEECARVADSYSRHGVRDQREMAGCIADEIRAIAPPAPEADHG